MRRQQCRRDNARGSRECSGCDVAVTWPEKKSLDLFHQYIKVQYQVQPLTITVTVNTVQKTVIRTFVETSWRIRNDVILVRDDIENDRVARVEARNKKNDTKERLHRSSEQNIFKQIDSCRNLFITFQSPVCLLFVPILSRVCPEFVPSLSPFVPSLSPFVPSLSRVCPELAPLLLRDHGEGVFLLPEQRQSGLLSMIE
jgi:hypothetical protein